MRREASPVRTRRCFRRSSSSAAIPSAAGSAARTRTGRHVGRNGGLPPNNSWPIHAAPNPNTLNTARMCHILPKPLSRDLTRARARRLIAQITRLAKISSRRGRHLPIQVKERLAATIQLAAPSATTCPMKRRIAAAFRLSSGTLRRPGRSTASGKDRSTTASQAETDMLITVLAITRKVSVPEKTSPRSQNSKKLPPAAIAAKAATGAASTIIERNIPSANDAAPEGCNAARAFRCGSKSRLTMSATPMEPSRRPANGKVTCQTVPSFPSAVSRRAASPRRLGACTASAARAEIVPTARSAASPSAANPWTIGPISGGSRPAIEKSGMSCGIYRLALIILGSAPSLPAHRNDTGGLRRQHRGLSRSSCRAKVQHQRNQSGPAGLVRGTEATAGIAVKELVEQQIITADRVLLLHRRCAEDRPMSVLAAKEDAAQPAGKLDGDFAEMQHGAGSYRAFDLEIVAVIAVKPPQRFDDQRVYRHPDRTAPVRVAAKHPGGRISGDVADAQPGARMVEDIGVLSVHFGERADAEIGKEQGLIEHPIEEALHPMSAEQRQQVRLPGAGVMPSRNQAREVRTVLEKPMQPRTEMRQSRNDRGVEHLDREKRDQPDQRAHPQRDPLATGQMKDIVVELVLIVP